MNRINLNVPFKHKTDAKRMGAWWDPRIKTWYARNGEQCLVKRWGTNASTKSNFKSHSIKKFLQMKKNRLDFRS